MPDNVVIKFQSDVTELKPAVDALLLLGKITEDDARAFNKASAAQKELAASAAQGAGSFDKLATSAQNVKKNIIDGAINKAIEGTVKATEKANATTKVYDNSIRGLKQQYKDLLSTAIAAGEKSPIGKQALKDAGELKDRLSDLQQTTKNFGSDTATFDAVGQGIATIGAGFQAAQGAQALFGDGSEDLQKSLLKLQAIMALTNGLQQIQNNLQAESALRLKLASIQQAVYTTVVGTSTGAMKAFRIALAATGIGALVLGIIALITNFDAISKSVKDFINKFEFLKPVVEELTKSFERFKEIFGFGEKLSEDLQEVADYVDKLLALQNDFQNRHLALKKSNGENTRDLEKRTNALLIKDQQIAFAVQKDLFIQKAKELGKIDAEEKQKFIEKANEAANAINALQVRNNEIDFENQQRGLKANKNAIDSRLQFAQKGSEAELKLKLNQINAELAIENSQRDKVAGQVGLNEAKANVARKAAYEEYKAFQIQKDIDTGNEQLTIVQAGSLKELNIRRNLLDLENELTLNNSKLSQTQKELNIAKNAQAELELIRKYGEAQVTLAEQIELKKQSVGNDRLAKIEADNEAELDYFNKLAELEYKSGYDSFLKQEALQLTKFFNESRRLDLKLSKVQETNNNILESEKQLQRDLESKISDDPANRKLYELSILESQDRIVASEQLTADEIVKINREKNLAIQENDNTTAALKKANLEKNLAQIQDLANQSISVLNQANDLQLQNTLNKLDEESAANKANFDKGVINEKEFAYQKEIIQKKENEAKVKAFNQNKALQLAQVIINTAVGITKTISELGFPVAIPFVALAVAAGALQTAAVASQKPPKFAKGTKNAPKGWAWVGEEGAELISLKGGEEIKTAPESKTFSNNYFKETLATRIDTAPTLKRDTRPFIQASSSLDYGMLSSMISKGVGEQLSQLPFTQINLDKNGITSSFIQGANKTTYLDNRYSSN